jgi:hypothetical protein
VENETTRALGFSFGILCSKDLVRLLAEHLEVSKLESGSTLSEIEYMFEDRPSSFYARAIILSKDL